MSAVGDARKRQTEQTADWCHPDADVRALVAEKCEQARAEGAAAALREAAVDLEGRLGTADAPKNLWEFRRWLRDRALSLAPTTEGGEVRP